MDSGRDQDWAAQVAAALAWWRDAGVEHAFADVPRPMLAPPSAASDEARLPAVGDRPNPAVPAAEPLIGGDRSRWPAELAAFGDWWLTEPSLAPAPGRRRVLPSGPPGAALMVIVGHPEPGDGDTLLSGPEGRLLDAMLAAFAIPRAEVYLASALPCHLAHPDWSELASGGLGEVLAHHVALATPSRLLLFGRGSVSTLLTHDSAHPAAACLTFDTAAGSLPLAVAPALAALLERPALKAGVWTRWLEWTGTR